MGRTISKSLNKANSTATIGFVGRSILRASRLCNVQDARRYVPVFRIAWRICSDEHFFRWPIALRNIRCVVVYTKSGCFTHFIFCRRRIGPFIKASVSKAQSGRPDVSVLSLQFITEPPKDLTRNTTPMITVARKTPLRVLDSERCTHTSQIFDHITNLDVSFRVIFCRLHGYFLESMTLSSSQPDRSSAEGVCSLVKDVLRPICYGIKTGLFRK
jgi:hypothetical protein